MRDQKGNTLGVTDLLPTPLPFVTMSQPTASLGCPLSIWEWGWHPSFWVLLGGTPTVSQVISQGKALARGAAHVLYQGVSAVTRRARACVGRWNKGLCSAPPSPGSGRAVWCWWDRTWWRRARVGVLYNGGQKTAPSLRSWPCLALQVGFDPHPPMRATGLPSTPLHSWWKT